MRLVIPFLLLGALALDLCQAQDYPVFRRARIRTEVEDSQEAGQISQQRGRKFKVRVRPRPTVVTSISDEEDDQSLEAVPQTLNVVTQPHPTHLIPQEPVRLVTNSPYQQTRSRVTSAQPAIPIPTAVRERKEPIQAIRNYSKINQDGSFTFGYEAADGSFKEETRGVDCVVRGKYGYIDPSGVRREFSYVSGNPCDPNATEEDEEEEDDPSLPPSRVYHRRPVTTASPTLIPYEQKLEQILEEQVPEDQLPEIYRQVAVPRPVVTTTRRPVQQTVVTHAPTPRPFAHPSVLAVNSLSAAYPLAQPLIQEEPTTYRPSLRLRYATTTPAPTLATPSTRPPTTLASPPHDGAIFSFDYDVTQDNVFQPRRTPTYAIPSPQTYIRQPQPQPQPPVPVPQQPVYIRHQSPLGPPTSHVNVALPAATLGQTIFHSGAAAPELHHTAVQPQRPALAVRPHFQVPTARTVQKKRKLTTTTAKPPSPAQVIQKAQQAEAEEQQRQQQQQQVPSAPVYTSELVFDPRSGQYTTVLLQQLPKSDAEVAINHRLQAFVQPPSPAPTVILRSQAQPPAGHPHLANFVQQPHPLQYQPAALQPYYVTNTAGRGNVAAGQIDHFLRNYNVPF